MGCTDELRQQKLHMYGMGMADKYADNRVPHSNHVTSSKQVA